MEGILRSVNTVIIYKPALKRCMFGLKLQLIYDRQSVGQPILVSGAHLGPMTNFSFCLKFPLDSCGFVIL
jgi:hypothetical protein